MARYTGSVCRMCRREGRKLFLKGERCTTTKCAIEERNDERRKGTPGQHGMNHKKISEYGTQLRAKQMTKRYYGVNNETQFFHYYELAEKKAGVTGENLLRILESRLDNVIYRMGLASSRAQARQFVVHGHYTVNGKRVNVPSYLVREGEEISIANKSKAYDSMKSVIEANSARPVPMWLDMNKDALTAKVVRMPNRDEIDLEVEETLIVELYSK